MSQFNQIDTFVTVVEQNSFASAAKKLAISAAAVSKQINALEKHLQVQLLIRTTRQLQLTAIGKAYYEQCKRILLAVDEADKLVSQMHDEPSGTLHIVSTYYFGEHYILPYLAEFITTYPQVIINIELVERIPDLMRENIDLLFGISEDPSPELVRRKIASARSIVCATPEYLKQQGIPKKPTDLKKYFIITHSNRPVANSLFFKNNQEITVTPRLYLNNNEAIRTCVLNNIGIAQLHSFVINEDLRKGKLQEILADYAAPEHPIYLYYQRSRYLQPKIRRFIDFILEKIGKN